MNYYAKAIEIVTSERSDWHEIVIRIAKKHPKVVADAASFADWKTEAKALVSAGNKIEAIKLCRTATGKNLKDAKHLVETLEMANLNASLLSSVANKLR